MTCFSISCFILEIVAVTSLWKTAFPELTRRKLLFLLFRKEVYLTLSDNIKFFFFVLSVISLFCNIYSYCSCLLYLSHLFLYSFGIALSPHYFFSFILQTSKLLMCLHQVFLHQTFSLVPRGKCANFELYMLYVTGYSFGLSSLHSHY